ncbi:MAG: hypothetical protein ACTSPD_18735 [Promethearchaeota archaeon]
MSRFTKLKSGEINWSSSIREWIKENEQRDVCSYCGKKLKNLTTNRNKIRALLPFFGKMLGKVHFNF